MKPEDAQEKARVEVMKSMRETDWIMRRELLAWQAKEAWLKFNAAQKEGFNVLQALELCVKRWEL